MNPKTPIETEDVMSALGALVMALGSTMPRNLIEELSASLQVCAQVQHDRGRTNAGRLIEDLVQALKTGGSLPKTPR